MTSFGLGLLSDGEASEDGVQATRLLASQRPMSQVRWEGHAQLCNLAACAAPARFAAANVVDTSPERPTMSVCPLPRDVQCMPCAG